jgi:hypothetical protein
MWYCWKHKPHPHVNVNQFWEALKASELAFNPLPLTSDSDNREREGVFPLTYLRGIDGIFISIASSSERAHELYERAAEILNQLEKEVTVKV